jgi:hypothetical protein
VGTFSMPPNALAAMWGRVAWGAQVLDVRSPAFAYAGSDPAPPVLEVLEMPAGEEHILSPRGSGRSSHFDGWQSCSENTPCLRCTLRLTICPIVMSSSDRSITCPVCLKTYSRSDHLQRHLKARRFVAWSWLMTSRGSHNGGPCADCGISLDAPSFPYRCPICMKGFKRR